MPDNAPAQFNDCRFVFGALSFLQLASQLLKLRRFRGSESAASQQNKNDDCERFSKWVAILAIAIQGFKHFREASGPLPVRRKLFPLGQSLNTSHRLAVRLARVSNGGARAR